MDGELVSVFVSLEDFARDEKLPLFCVVPKGGGLVGAPLVKQTAS